MNRDELLIKAKEIRPFSLTAYQEYHQKTALLIDQINRNMLERSDLSALIGTNNEKMMQDNHANHVRFIASLLKNYNPEVLVDTVLWVFRAYRSHGFTTNYWATQLNMWIEIIRELLSDTSYAEIYPLYEWMQVNIPSFVNLSDEKLSGLHSAHES